MIRRLVILCSLAILVVIPALSFADDFQKAQLQILESSNLDAWKLLEADPGSKQPAAPPEYASFADEKSASNFIYDRSDDISPAGGLPPQIPEPATLIMLGIGLIGLGARRKLGR